MNKTAMLIILFFLGYFISAQSISFDQDQIDYGTIKKDSDGNQIFKFTNTGDKPLIISNVKSSCECSVPSWTKTPILPGKSGEINVKYNTKKLGKFSKSIEVYSNDPKVSRKLLKIKGQVQ
ncbi:Protein of unknown function (DUF1573) [Apibacter mensalis]|uniref:DUF1573 domain-containing protein n=1 Tax=Apibacter mensalis TaxID=1586267 RepID=A0A0X3ANM1_9FLAO|nr:DUF1573 domain-containing protein [Apibacter mensalis]CVK15645.1 Protein of unknown function (DUF1573) [Apibacter mensalis]